MPSLPFEDQHSNTCRAMLVDVFQEVDRQQKIAMTGDAFIPAIKRANYQTMEWLSDDEVHPKLSSSVKYGWILEDRLITPVECEIPCTPESILRLIKCSRAKTRCSPFCKYLASSLHCMEMCECTVGEDQCDNQTMTLMNKCFQFFISRLTFLGLPKVNVLWGFF